MVEALEARIAALEDENAILSKDLGIEAPSAGKDAVKATLHNRNDNLAAREAAARAILKEVPVLVDLTACNGSEIIDGLMFSQLLVAGFCHLLNNRDMLNRENVFPIADGDTGTNMCLCMKKPVRNLLAEPAEALTAAASNMGADVLLYGQGNSGTILSFYFISLAEELGNGPAQKQTISEFVAAIKTVGRKMPSALWKSALADESACHAAIGAI